MADESLGRPLRVMHAPHDIGGNAAMLARGERSLGLDSRNLVYTKQWYGYGADICLDLPQDSNPAYSPRWWARMVRLALTQDVFHFNFGASFLTYYPERWVFPDLPLWRAMGIPCFVTFQGCEARLSSFAEERFAVQACSVCPSRDLFCTVGYDIFKREVLALVGRHFDQVFAVNPDLLHNIPGGRFLPYANCDLDRWTPAQGFDHHHAGPVRILHAPTNRRVKGTEAIISAVQALKAEGLAVELVLVENIPHDQVRALYEGADLLIDQVLVGWYGGLAVELMALGKPVVAYIREEDLVFLPPGMREDLPVVSAHAGDLVEKLRPLVLDAALRQALGQRSRSFVEKWHHPRAVAGITSAAYRQALGRRPGRLTPGQRAAAAARLLRPVAGYLALIYRNNFHQSPLGRKIREWMGRA